MSENILISVLTFLFSGGNHAKERTVNTIKVMCHFIAIMGIDIEKTTQLVSEMKQSGLIQFDEFGNVGLLVLEEEHEAHYS